MWAKAGLVGRGPDEAVGLNLRLLTLPAARPREAASLSGDGDVVGAVRSLWGPVGFQQDPACGVSWVAQDTQEALPCRVWLPGASRVLGSESLPPCVWVWRWPSGTSAMVCRARLSAAQARAPENPCPSRPGRRQPLARAPARTSGLPGGGWSRRGWAEGRRAVRGPAGEGRSSVASCRGVSWPRTVPGEWLLVGWEFCDETQGWAAAARQGGSPDPAPHAGACSERRRSVSGPLSLPRTENSGLSSQRPTEMPGASEVSVSEEPGV